MPTRNKHAYVHPEFIHSSRELITAHFFLLSTHNNYPEAPRPFLRRSSHHKSLSISHFAVIIRGLCSALDYSSETLPEQIRTQISRLLRGDYRRPLNGDAGTSTSTISPR